MMATTYALKCQINAAVLSFCVSPPPHTHTSVAQDLIGQCKNFARVDVKNLQCVPLSSLLFSLLQLQTGFTLKFKHNRQKYIIGNVRLNHRLGFCFYYISLNCNARVLFEYFLREEYSQRRGEINYNFKITMMYNTFLCSCFNKV